MQWSTPGNENEQMKSTHNNMVASDEVEIGTEDCMLYYSIGNQLKAGIFKI